MGVPASAAAAAAVAAAIAVAAAGASTAATHAAATVVSAVNATLCCMMHGLWRAVCAVWNVKSTWCQVWDVMCSPVAYVVVYSVWYVVCDM